MTNDEFTRRDALKYGGISIGAVGLGGIVSGQTGEEENSPIHNDENDAPWGEIQHDQSLSHGWAIYYQDRTDGSDRRWLVIREYNWHGEYLTANSVSKTLPDIPTGNQLSTFDTKANAIEVFNSWFNSVEKGDESWLPYFPLELTHFSVSSGYSQYVKMAWENVLDIPIGEVEVVTVNYDRASAPSSMDEDVPGAYAYGVHSKKVQGVAPNTAWYSSFSVRNVTDKSNSIDENESLDIVRVEVD